MCTTQSKCVFVCPPDGQLIVRIRDYVLDGQNDDAGLSLTFLYLRDVDSTLADGWLPKSHPPLWRNS